MTEGVLTSTGVAPKPADGEIIAYFNGKATTLKSSVSNGILQVELPNGVRIAVGGSSSTNTPLAVGPDGVLRLSKADSVRIVASGMSPGSRYGLVVFSDPVKLGDGTADADGNINSTIKLASAIPAGRHTLQINGTSSLNRLVSISTPIQIYGKSSSNFGRAVLAALVLALIIAVTLPASFRRRRRETTTS